MSTAFQRRARAALTARMASSLPASALHEDGRHTRALADALVPTLSASEVAWVHAELSRGAKGTLRPTRAGAVPVYNAWSSTLHVASAFAPWRATPEALRVAGRTGFTDVRLEERLLIPHGGGTPNLDVALPGPHGAFTGAESKLTEHLAPHPPHRWAPAYLRPAMAAALTDGWADVFSALLAGRWSPRYLDAAQLVKHALSLQAKPEATSTRLVLLFWEPTDGDEVPEVVAHREEVAELVDRLGPDASPQLVALSYAEVLDEWETQRPEHVAALRARYEVSVRGDAP